MVRRMVGGWDGWVGRGERLRVPLGVSNEGDERERIERRTSELQDFNFKPANGTRTEQSSAEQGKNEAKKVNTILLYPAGQLQSQGTQRREKKPSSRRILWRSWGAGRASAVFYSLFFPLASRRAFVACESSCSSWLRWGLGGGRSGMVACWEDPIFKKNKTCLESLHLLCVRR